MIGKTVVFIGPSGSDCLNTRQHDKLEFRPPVERGGIDDALSDRQTKNIVIVDGVFHAKPAVGHLEIRRALESGCCVWGLCSMGAIRAAEMRTLGMKGYGRLFRLFSSKNDFMDDEVALLFEPFPPYNAISEPLVHLRLAIRRFARHAKISRETAAMLEEKLKLTWFGNRTLDWVRHELSRLGIGDIDFFEFLLQNSRIKNLDWLDFSRTVLPKLESGH
jgi:hypothetical protein